MIDEVSHLKAANVCCLDVLSPASVNAESSLSPKDAVLHCF